MNQTIEIDLETAHLVERLARLRRASNTVVVKEAIVASARTAGLSPVDISNLSIEERRQRIVDAVSAIPQRLQNDTRTPDEIIGYDEHGLP
jgi:hypothetical protein